MPGALKFLSVDEIISFFESHYNNEQQESIVQILFRLEHTIEPSQLLDDLLKQNVLQISQTPYFSYRLRKFYEKHNIQKVSERKELIFSKVPDLKGLNRGKSASYDDLVDFVSKKYPDILSEILKDIKVYSFTEPYSQNGRTALLYLNRKLNPKANYKFDSNSNSYVLKEDEVTEVLRRHNIQFEVDNPAELFTIHVKLESKPCQMPLWKIILLVIFWPAGLYYLLTKKNRSTND